MIGCFTPAWDKAIQHGNFSSDHRVLKMRRPDHDAQTRVLSFCPLHCMLQPGESGLAPFTTSLYAEAAGSIIFRKQSCIALLACQQKLMSVTHRPHELQKSGSIALTGRSVMLGFQWLQTFKKPSLMDTKPTKRNMLCMISGGIVAWIDWHK